MQARESAAKNYQLAVTAGQQSAASIRVARGRRGAATKAASAAKHDALSLQADMASLAQQLRVGSAKLERLATDNAGLATQVRCACGCPVCACSFPACACGLAALR